MRDRNKGRKKRQQGIANTKKEHAIDPCNAKQKGEKKKRATKERKTDVMTRQARESAGGLFAGKQKRKGESTLGWLYLFSWGGGCCAPRRFPQARSSSSGRKGAKEWWVRCCWNSRGTAAAARLIRAGALKPGKEQQQPAAQQRRMNQGRRQGRRETAKRATNRSRRVDRHSENISGFLFLGGGSK